MDKKKSYESINRNVIIFQCVTAANQMCVRMAQNVLSMTVALSVSVRQGTKEHTVTVSK